MTYNLNIDGLTIGNKSYCPKATAELLKEAGFIEEWVADENGEPIILQSDPREPLGYTYNRWYEFVRYFLFPEIMAQAVLVSIANVSIAA